MSAITAGSVISVATSRKRLSMPSSCWRSLLSAISSFRLIGGKLCSETFFHLHFHLQLVEAFAVHAVHMSLRAERVGVDALYYPANGHGFDFAAHYQKHFHFFLGIPSHACQDSASAVRLVVDGCGYLFPLGGKDGELHRLAVGVDYHVGHVGAEKEHYEAEHHFVDLQGNEVRRGYDEQVGIEHRAPHGHVGVFAHHGSDYVGAAGGTVVSECKTDAETCGNAADYYVEEAFVGESRGQQRLEDAQENAHHGASEDGAEHKLFAHNLVCYGQQGQIEGIVGDCHRNAGEEVDNGAKTCGTTDYHPFGKNETAESEGIDGHAQRDEDIVAGRAPQVDFFSHYCNGFDDAIIRGKDNTFYNSFPAEAKKNVKAAICRAMSGRMRVPRIWRGGPCPCL